MVASLRAFLGNGIIRPFQRDLKSDFAHAPDVELVKACVGQVLGTRCSTADGNVQGELPWRPEFGSLLELLRQKPNDPVTQQIARTYVADALSRWEPRIRLRAVSITTEKSTSGQQGGDDTIVIKLRYDLITSNVSNNAVVVPDISQTVKV